MPEEENASSRAERRKRDPIGQILDLLSNSNHRTTTTDHSVISSVQSLNSSADDSPLSSASVVSSAKSSVSSVQSVVSPSFPTMPSSSKEKNNNIQPVKHNKNEHGHKNSMQNSFATPFEKQYNDEPVVHDESSAFQPFSKNMQNVSNGFTNDNYSYCVQKGFAMMNNYAAAHMHTSQSAMIPFTAGNVPVPVTAGHLYGISGYSLPYTNIPNTITQTTVPQVGYPFPHSCGLFSNFDVTRNINMFSWLDKKIGSDSSFNPACILNSENTGNHVTHTPPRYQCDSCKKSYSTYGGLSKHKQFHCVNQVKKEFSCKFCGKCYGSLGALKMHIRTHTLPCKCKICGKAFSRPWLLQGHIRTHTGEKPFRCDHCSRAFADRSNLRAHLQTHSEIKKYGCKSCNKTFSRMSLLVKHKENHCYR
ncbi:zinc finger protein SNAI2-like [Mytilus californianus]|uniref:zinc finger protein SNAI2-like n=1 Tax=Mytilus californianus TaxID=6549 RepID=UPI002245F839|nr:zinc finger protein SNAI2-like [Mytilus californianus]